MSHFSYYYAECRYAECRYAECRYAECRYAECRYAECRGADGSAKHSIVLRHGNNYFRNKLRNAGARGKCYALFRRKVSDQSMKKFCDIGTRFR
jgi:hypothetical protein